MVKEYPVEVVLVRVYCNKCGNLISTVRTLFAEPLQYEYTCESCGNVQVKSIVNLHSEKKDKGVRVC